MFLLGISMNCGFVGGVIFPFLTIGTIAGVLLQHLFNYLPLGLCVGTFMFSIGCGLIPAPFTFTALSAFLFYFGAYQTVPVFIAIITSYTIVR